MIPFEKLPTLNALLNSLAAVCLLFGWWAIRRGQKERHKYFMVSAVVLSTMFLVSYLTYHHFVGVTRFQGEGVIRGIYFFILGTHTPLAALIVPFILAAVWFALKGNFASHTKITRWLLPVWLYVAVTGVMIYVLLYI